MPFPRTIYTMLNLRDAQTCQYDLVSLGECMLRLSPPGHGRLEFSPTLEVWVGGGDRIGLNFTEGGMGVRASVTLYDRGHSAASHMKPEHVVWGRLFGKE